MVGYSCAVVIGFLFPCHRSRPPVLKASLVKEIALKHGAVPGDKAAPCVFWYLLGGAGVVQDNPRKCGFRPAAYPEIHVVLDLTGEEISVRALGGKYQVNTKGPPQTGEGGKPVLDLTQPLPVLLAPARRRANIRIYFSRKGPPALLVRSPERPAGRALARCTLGAASVPSSFPPHYKTVRRVRSRAFTRKPHPAIGPANFAHGGAI